MNKLLKKLYCGMGSNFLGPTFSGYGKSGFANGKNARLWFGAVAIRFRGPASR